MYIFSIQFNLPNRGREGINEIRSLAYWHRVRCPEECHWLRGFWSRIFVGQITRTWLRYKGQHLMPARQKGPSRGKFQSTLYIWSHSFGRRKYYCAIFRATIQWKIGFGKGFGEHDWLHLGGVGVAAATSQGLTWWDWDWKCRGLFNTGVTMRWWGKINLTTWWWLMDWISPESVQDRLVHWDGSWGGQYCWCC